MLVDYKSTIEGKDQRLPLTSDFFQTLDAGYDFEHRFTAWGNSLSLPVISEMKVKLSETINIFPQPVY